MRPFYFALLLFLVGLSGCRWLPDVHEAPQIYSLNLQEGWEVEVIDQTPRMTATVPGVVHQDLIANDIIPDPFYGTNELKVQWLDTAEFKYYHTLSIPAEFYQQESIRLEFDGLDTYADIYLNDTLLLQTNNMFRAYELEIKHLIDSTRTNELTIHFKSPILENRARLNALPYAFPAGNDVADEKSSVFTRKAPFQFGWDWSPRLVTAGIWRDVRLVASSKTRILNTQFETVSLNEKKAELKAHVTIHSPVDVEAAALRILDDSLNHKWVHHTLNLKAGTHVYEVPFKLRNPKLWWPNGYGSQHLYRAEVLLEVNQRLQATAHDRFGLRTIELVQEADDIGTSFYFKVNGKPVFAKGANYIPQDVLLPRRDQRDVDELLLHAQAAHMNMLRVWGGGIYESDAFYDRCDELGLMVWQDFMFACTMYPGDEEFFGNVKAEVEDNVRRLRNHPSIVLWCGNNEIDVAWHNWGWQTQYAYTESDSAQLWNDYQALFHELIPGVLEELDPSRAYVSTSPLSNWGTPENFNHSSMHYWGVWHGREPFENYRTNVGRFMSEYGFQSFPSLSTIASFADTSGLTIEDEVMAHHQKSYIGNGMITQHLETYFNPGKDLESFLYLSQLTQAHGVGLAITNHRMKKGHCMGTLYWQLNDCWPGPSWSSIDYAGNWKALHHRVKKLYKAQVVLVDRAGEDVVAHVVTDGLFEFRGKVLVEWLAFDGTVLKQEEVTVNLSADENDRVWSQPFDAVWEGFDTTSTVLSFTLQTLEGRERDRTFFFGAAPKHLKLQQPELEYVVSENSKGYDVAVNTNTLVYALEVKLPGKGWWTENFMHLVPGKWKAISFLTKDEIEDFKKQVQFRSLVDTY